MNIFYIPNYIWVRMWTDRAGRGCIYYNEADMTQMSIKNYEYYFNTYLKWFVITL